MTGPTAQKSAPEKGAAPAEQQPEERNRLAGPGGAYHDILALQTSAGNRAVSAALRGGGRPLDPTLRAEMEARFGQDFSQVRVHTDRHAAESAAALSAAAYTVGRDVVFGAGRYVPGTGDGKHLLAHELTHVVQQSRGGAAPSAAHEADAQQAAGAAVSGSGPVQVAGASGVGVARQPLTEEEIRTLSLDKLKQRYKENEEEAWSSNDPALLAEHYALKRQIDLRKAGLPAPRGADAPKSVQPAKPSKVGATPGVARKAGAERPPAAAHQDDEMALEDAWEGLQKVRKDLDNYVISPEVKEKLDAKRKHLERLLYGETSEEQQERFLRNIGFLPGEKVPDPRPTFLRTRKQLAQYRKERAAEKAEAERKRAAVEQAEREKVLRSKPTDPASVAKKVLAEAGLQYQRPLTDFEVLMRTTKSVNITSPAITGKVEEKKPVASNTLEPLHDAETGDVIGYYSRSAGADYTLVDVNGNIVQQGDNPNEAPVIDPIDLIPMGGAGAKAVGGAAKFTGRFLFNQVSKRAPNLLMRLRRTAAATAIGLAESGAAPSIAGGVALGSRGVRAPIVQVLDEAAEQAPLRLAKPQVKLTTPKPAAPKPGAPAAQPPAPKPAALKPGVPTAQPPAPKPAAPKPAAPKPGTPAAQPSVAAPTKPAAPALGGTSRQQQAAAQLQNLEQQISADRARVAAVKGGMSEAQWAKQRAGATKRLYNMLEKRAVLERVKTFPNRTYLEQAEIVGIERGGSLVSTNSIAGSGKGRIADALELQGKKVILEDFKSPSTQLKSVKGGVKRPSSDIEGEFRKSSEIAKQHKVEQDVLSDARSKGGKIVIRGRDPLTGNTVEIRVDPDDIGSRVTDYNVLPGN